MDPDGCIGTVRKEKLYHQQNGGSDEIWSIDA